MKNYYEILNLDSNCSSSDIKSSYYSLCKKYHPDKNGGDDTMFREVKEAYDVLSDSSLRADYDFELSDGYIPKNINIRYDINVSLTDCYKGVERKIKIGDKTVGVKIPPYSKEGDSVIIKDMGWNGGDLELCIHIPKDDDLWMDEKSNIHFVKHINLWDGILGCSFDVDVFDEHVQCNIKRCTYRDSTVVFIGKGYHIGDRRSHLIIDVKLDYPKQLNDEQIDLINRVRDLDGTY